MAQCPSSVMVCTGTTGIHDLVLMGVPLLAHPLNMCYGDRKNHTCYSAADVIVRISLQATLLYGNKICLLGNGACKETRAFKHNIFFKI